MKGLKIYIRKSFPEVSVLFHGTTVIAVKKDGRVAIAGDGRVTLGQNIVMKNQARKVRTLHNGEVLAGFAVRWPMPSPYLTNLKSS